jgi:hypothetical protein
MQRNFRFNFLTFILGFAIGILYIFYIDENRQREIIKYPTPYNVQKTVYKGIADDCYKFTVKEVQCTKDALIQPIM